MEYVIDELLDILNEINGDPIQEILWKHLKIFISLILNVICIKIEIYVDCWNHEKLQSLQVLVAPNDVSIIKNTSLKFSEFA